MEMPIPDDWDGEACCRYSIKWPDSSKWKAILFGLVSMPDQGRFWDFDTGHFLTLREQFRPFYEHNFDLPEVIMACNDTNIADALTAIASSQSEIATALSGLSELAVSVQSLANNQCCGDLQIDVQGGLQGSIDQGEDPPIPIYGSTPPIGLEPGEFPPEYPDLDAYLADKCKKANKIFDGIVGALTNIAAFGTFNAVTLAALLAVAIPTGIIFPPAMIPTAISILLLLSGSLFVVAQLVSAMNTNREDFICAMIEGDTTEAIIENMSDAIDLILAGIPITGVIGWAVKSLFLLLANTNTLNTLFDGSLIAGYEDADCSGCGGCDVTFSFQSGAGSWEFAQDVSGGTASGQAINGRLENAISASGPNSYAWASWILDLSAIVCNATSGDTISALFAKLTGGANSPYCEIVVLYDDATSESAADFVTTSDTINLTLTQNKQIALIRLTQRLSIDGGGGSFDITGYVDDVHITMSNPTDCPDQA